MIEEEDRQGLVYESQTIATSWCSGYHADLYGPWTWRERWRGFWFPLTHYREWKKSRDACREEEKEYRAGR